MIKKLTLGDKILFVLLLLLTIHIFRIAYNGLAEGSTALIVVNNKEFGRFPLNKDRKISIKGKNGETIVEIKNGKARISQSPCPNKICVKLGWISHINRMSVCLPNRVLLKIIGTDNSDIDAVVG